MKMCEKNLAMTEAYIMAADNFFKQFNYIVDYPINSPQINTYETLYTMKSDQQFLPQAELTFDTQNSITEQRNPYYNNESSQFDKDNYMPECITTDLVSTIITSPIAIENIMGHVVRTNENVLLTETNYRRKPQFSTSAICSVCKRIFTCQSKLDIHFRSHSGERPFGCQQCDKRFSRDVHLKEHTYVHTGNFPFPCNECNKSFARKSMLTRHMFVHNNVRPYECSVCEKRFYLKSDLGKHLYSHQDKTKLGEPTIQCDICKKYYHSDWVLKKHKLTHSEKKLKCQYCEKKFWRNSNLKKHLVVHTGEKAFICKICNKSFNQNAILKRHTLIHSEARPHKCPDCDKSFAEKILLKTHFLKHSGLKPFICNVCEKSFSSAAYLKVHSRKCSVKKKQGLSGNIKRNFSPSLHCIKSYKDTAHLKKKSKRSKKQDTPKRNKLKRVKDKTRM